MKDKNPKLHASLNFAIIFLLLALFAIGVFMIVRYYSNGARYLEEGPYIEENGGEE